MPSRRRGDAALIERLATWFAAHARPLPWRTLRGDRRDPWASLVSEAMLQQTQVSRVQERFGPFLWQFPTPEAMAAADEQTVLAAWSGLGYYRRARMLHKASQEIVSRFGARVPDGVADLRTLPGVGPYTAGAISSIVFGRAEPIVDGNVARVLVRVRGEDAMTSAPATMKWAWSESSRLAELAHRLGRIELFNEGLMELGATICAPRAPRCGECPLASLCKARRSGREREIPRAAVKAKPRVVHHAAVLVRDGRGRILVHPRPPDGLWAGMWQAPTHERDDRAPTLRELSRWIGLTGVSHAGAFTHRTTHRLVEFVVWRASARGLSAEAKGRLATAAGPGARWMSEAGLAGLPLATAHRRILLGLGHVR